MDSPRSKRDRLTRAIEDADEALILLLNMIEHDHQIQQPWEDLGFRSLHETWVEIHTVAEEIRAERDRDREFYCGFADQNQATLDLIRTLFGAPGRESQEP